MRAIAKLPAAASPPDEICFCARSHSPPRAVICCFCKAPGFHSFTSRPRPWSTPSPKRRLRFGSSAAPRTRTVCLWQGSCPPCSRRRETERLPFRPAAGINFRRRDTIWRRVRFYELHPHPPRKHRHGTHLLRHVRQAAPYRKGGCSCPAPCEDTSEGAMGPQNEWGESINRHGKTASSSKFKACFQNHRRWGRA